MDKIYLFFSFLFSLIVTIVTLLMLLSSIYIKKNIVVLDDFSEVDIVVVEKIEEKKLENQLESSSNYNNIVEKNSEEKVEEKVVDLSKPKLSLKDRLKKLFEDANESEVQKDIKEIRKANSNNSQSLKVTQKSDIDINKIFETDSKNVDLAKSVDLKFKRVEIVSATSSKSNIDEDENTKYFRIIRDELASRWIPISSDAGKSAEILIKIGVNGSFSYIITKHSSDTSFLNRLNSSIRDLQKTGLPKSKKPISVKVNFIAKDL